MIGYANLKYHDTKSDKITLQFAKEALKPYISLRKKKVNIDRIQEFVDQLEIAMDDPSKRMITGYDQQFFEDYFGTKKEVDVRQFVAYFLERIAKSIRNMYWMTEQDYFNDSDKRCPKCGSSDLDID